MISDLTGEIFGKLTVVSLNYRQSGKGNGRFWNCVCECGRRRVVVTSNLKNGFIAMCRKRNHIENMVGEGFGRLVVLSFHSMSASSVSKWNCLCNCGRKCVVARSSLLTGHTKSCGCFNAEPRANCIKHHLCDIPEYVVWQMMRQRCRNENSSSYHGYGAKGIECCDRWDDFELFYADMGPRPTTGL